ncbi:MAG: hypothetical protein JWQ97_3233 [Phenylobacterium sp.]|nr:hypothetical protein [Phenylobacterium sp.]
MAKRSAAFAAAVALAAALAGCATPTPYQPNIPGQATSGGYSEVRIESNRWRVTFAGNSLTARETVEGYLLYRAAELTIQQGYDWFSIVDRNTQRSGYTYIEPDPLYHPWYGPGYGFWRPSWRYYGHGFGWRTWDPFFGDPFWADRLDVRTVEKFEATAEIVMGHGAKPADDPRAFDARQVIANLQPRIQYPAPKR